MPFNERRIRFGRAAIGLILTLMAGSLIWVSESAATTYVGESPGRWKARIEIRNDSIRKIHLVVPATCRNQGKSPSRSTLTWDSKGPHLRKYGGFYEESTSRWSKRVLKGRLIGDRIQGSLWFADMGDYVQCWTGTGKKPGWVSFKARKVVRQRG